MNTNINENNDPTPDLNPDAITGEPGSHPVGTGVGTAGAGIAGAAVGGVVGGPVGAVVGAVVGGVIGAVGGHAVGEAVDPTFEDAYWRKNHLTRPYASDNDYDTWSPAYRVGYQARGSRIDDNYAFEEAEPEMQKTYESGNHPLPWHRAKEASRAAWNRVEDNKKKQG